MEKQTLTPEQILKNQVSANALNRFKSSRFNAGNDAPIAGYSPWGGCFGTSTRPPAQPGVCCPCVDKFAHLSTTVRWLLALPSARGAVGVFFFPLHLSPLVIDKKPSRVAFFFFFFNHAAPVACAVLQLDVRGARILLLCGFLLVLRDVRSPRDDFGR